MSGLWSNNPKTEEGKYLVKRRDGSVPEWPYFVLGARDPAASWALSQYAERAVQMGMDQEYVDDIVSLAHEFFKYRKKFGDGDPDAGPADDLVDDPATVAEMAKGGGA